jgi:hypothetical protein
MSVFRLPLNLLVVLGTKLTDRANDVPSLQGVYLVIVGMHVIAMLIQVLLLTNSKKSKESLDKSKSE